VTDSLLVRPRQVARVPPGGSPGTVSADLLTAHVAIRIGKRLTAGDNGPDLGRRIY